MPRGLFTFSFDAMTTDSRKQLTKFIIKVFLVCLPILILCCVCELTLRKAPNAYSLKFNAFKSSLDSIETLILGASNAYYGINPWYIDGYSFNMAMVSQKLLHDFYLLNKYIDKMPHLKTVILPLTYTSLFQIENEGEIKWRKYLYYHFYDHCPILIPKFSIGKYSVLQTLKFKPIKDIILNGSIKRDCDSKGWSGGYKAQISDLKKAGYLAAERHENGSFNTEKNLLLINNMIKICNNKKVKLVILFTPTLPAYTDNLNQKKLEIMFNEVNRLSYLNKDVYVLNYYYDKRFTMNDFYDGDHLNNYGARKLSKMIDETLKSYPLKN
jgi:hypothetical protein